MSEGDRLETSREVAEAKRRLEGIVESAMDAIITVDGKHNIIRLCCKHGARPRGVTQLGD